MCLEEEEDRESLKSHFDALASSLNDGNPPLISSPLTFDLLPVTHFTFDPPEKFDTDPQSLKPPDQKHFLNPRLSISTRFLSRFQDKIRSAYPQSSEAVWSVHTEAASLTPAGRSVAD